MGDQARNNSASRNRWTWWLLASAFLAALVGCSPFNDSSSGLVHLMVGDAAVGDAIIIEPGDADADAAEPTCDIHPSEEMGDDGCCGCHDYSVPELCDTSCQPTPLPCTDTMGNVIPCEGPLVVFDGTTTYYRIGSGTEPRDGEYEYQSGQSGENGKLKKEGGTDKKGVSFWDTEEAAKAARDRLKSGAKIHKVSFFPQADLTFVAKQPPNNHYHLVPNKADMTLKDYKDALKKVRLTKVEP